MIFADNFLKKYSKPLLNRRGFFVILNFFDIFAVVKEQLNIKVMKFTLKKIKEYLFVQRTTKSSFNVGKLGYYSHCKTDKINLYTLYFGDWFNKWFLERIEFLRWSKYGLPRIVISGPKHIFWWFLETSKYKNDFEYKRFQITKNDHISCG